jgi:hypothetical protein
MYINSHQCMWANSYHKQTTSIVRVAALAEVKWPVTCNLDKGETLKLKGVKFISYGFRLFSVTRVQTCHIHQVKGISKSNPWSISWKGLKGICPICFKLVLCVLCTWFKIYLLKLGQHIRGGLLIANHLDQSLWWAHQKHPPAVRSYFNILFSAGAKCWSAFYQAPQTVQLGWAKTIFVTQILHAMLLCRITYRALLEMLEV